MVSESIFYKLSLSGFDRKKFLDSEYGFDIFQVAKHYRSPSPGMFGDYYTPPVPTGGVLFD